MRCKLEIEACGCALTGPEEKDDRMAPTIVQKPKAQVVDEGETVTFECRLTAKPAPEVRTGTLYLLAPFGCWL